MRRAVIAAVLSMILLAVGWVTTGSIGAQAPGCLPTSARTVGPHGFHGLGVKRIAPVYTDALQYVLNTGFSGAKAQHEADVLNSFGFVSGTWQHYNGVKRNTRGDEGAALTEQFGSPEQAQAESNYLVAQIRRLQRWKKFTVSAIPGSRGFRSRYSDGSGASNLYFTDGNYAYFVGTFVLRGGMGTVRVIKAAIHLYNRVHGAVVCP